MDRTEKAAMVDDFKEDVCQAQSVVLTEFRALTVPQATELRRQLREQGVTYRVIKNTLAKRAVAGTDMEPLGKNLAGPTAWVYSKIDPITPAKVLTNFLKDMTDNRIWIKRGFLGGKVLTADQVNALSTLPGKDELRAKLLSVLQATGTNFVRVLAARPVEFLNVLKARGDSLEKSE